MEVRGRERERGGGWWCFFMLFWSIRFRISRKYWTNTSLTWVMIYLACLILQSCLLFSKSGPEDMVPDLFCKLQQRYGMIYVMIIWRRRILWLFSRVDCELIILIDTFLQPHSLNLFSVSLYMSLHYVACI